MVASEGDHGESLKKRPRRFPMFKAQPLDIDANRVSINNPPFPGDHHAVCPVSAAQHEGGYGVPEPEKRNSSKV